MTACSLAFSVAISSSNVGLLPFMALAPWVFPATGLGLLGAIAELLSIAWTPLLTCAEGGLVWSTLDASAPLIVADEPD